MTDGEVGVREFRRNLSAWLERAADGEQVTVTKRGAPWAAFGPPAAGELAPGLFARFQQEEAAERAEARRLEAELQERVEARLERLTWEAQQFSAARGLPWDPNRPFANLPTPDQRANAVFRTQDMEARAAERAAAREAGLEHLLPSVLSVRLDEMAAAAGALTPPVAAAPSTSVRSRIRAAVQRWATKPEVTRAASRASIDDHGDDHITRYTWMYQR